MHTIMHKYDMYTCVWWLLSFEFKTFTRCVWRQEDFGGAIVYLLSIILLNFSISILVRTFDYVTSIYYLLFTYSPHYLLYLFSVSLFFVINLQFTIYPLNIEHSTNHPNFKVKKSNTQYSILIHCSMPSIECPIANSVNNTCAYVLSVYVLRTHESE